MPLITFTRDFTWSPPEKRGRVQIEFKTGMTIFVRRKCAEAAIAAGVAELITKETKPMKRTIASLFALAFLHVSAFATDLSITAANVVAGSASTVENGTLGATVTAGQLLYKSSTAGTWALADGDSATAEVRQATGIALNGGASGQPVRVLREGTITIGATMTPGVAYYTADDPGGICPVADVASGDYVQIVGIAISATVLSVKFHYSGVAL